MIVFSNPLCKKRVSLIDLIIDFPQNAQFEFDLERCSFEDFVDYLALSDSPLEGYAMTLGDHLTSLSLRNMEMLTLPLDSSSYDQALLTLLRDKYFKELAKKPRYEFIAQFTFSLNDLDFPLIARFAMTWNHYFSYRKDDPCFLQLFFSFCDTNRREEVLLLLSEVCIEERGRMWPKELDRPETSALVNHAVYYKMVLALFDAMLSTTPVTIPPVAFLEHLFDTAPVQCKTLLDTLDGTSKGLMEEIIMQAGQKIKEKKHGNASLSSSKAAVFFI